MPKKTINQKVLDDLEVNNSKKKSSARQSASSSKNKNKTNRETVSRQRYTKRERAELEKGEKPTILDSAIPKSKEAKKLEIYRCCSCGTEFKKQMGNFPFSQSPMFYGNNHYLPICYKCLDSLYVQYSLLLNDEDEALRRVAMHWDMYYSDSLAQSFKNVETFRSKIKSYVKNCNLLQNADKTYDNYLMEKQEKAIRTAEQLEEVRQSKEFKVPQKTINFFGLGYTEDEYIYLQNQYQDWTKRHVCETKAQEELFKNLCISQLNINIAQQTGGKVAEAMKTFQDLLGSANLKPTQTNDNVLADTNTFGTLIKKWEDNKPIPKPEPEWEDVDGIVRYVNIYFLGHLCKMMGIKNNYARMYEEEMSKYRVKKPEYEGDDEALFDNIFSYNGNDGDI